MILYLENEREDVLLIEKPTLNDFRNYYKLARSDKNLIVYTCKYGRKRQLFKKLTSLRLFH